MKWKNSASCTTANKLEDRDMKFHKKQSVSSTTSMPFLRDDNLTFHRFTTDVSLDNSRRPSEDLVDATTVVDREKYNLKTSEQPTVWTTTNFMNYTTESNDFQYIPTTESTKSVQNGSTAKLIVPVDDMKNQQSKCSIFRGIILCLCLNITYANVVRFPRQLDYFGSAFLIPYFTILLLIGLPIVLFEISLGQFLGQNSAHSWKASPIFKGASFVGRIASWLTAVWTSLQAVIAIVYIGELTYKSIPFAKCANKVRLQADEITGYVIVAKNGQECLQQTVMVPVWENTFYFGLLSMGLIIVWIIAMICTYSSKVLRRAIFFIGLLTLSILIFETGWNVHKSYTLSQSVPVNLWPFNVASLANSTIWFNALVQVIYSTSIGLGVWPVLTGKFLYKGDAVRSTMVYMGLNIFVVALSVTFFMTQFDNSITRNSTIAYPELKPLTSVYDSALSNTDPILSRLIPGLAYLIVVLVAIMTIAISIYTASRLIKRHPNYILCLMGLVVTVLFLLYPNFVISRTLDGQIVGVLVTCALIFDIISITWIYKAKNIYTDLEFSIGRPILKLWVFMWCITPVFLLSLLIWWSIDYYNIFDPDTLELVVLRWAPILFSIIVIIVMASVQVYKQVDYNFCNMIKEAAQPSKDWGPADPIVRHAWKQWRSVCEDTGQKDFTLRRRGTRDYTHSIKKGQYSRAQFRIERFRKTSSPGSQTSNYNESMFEDSPVEDRNYQLRDEKLPRSYSNDSQKPITRHDDIEQYMYAVRPSNEADTTDSVTTKVKNPMARILPVPVPIRHRTSTSDYNNTSQQSKLNKTNSQAVDPNYGSFQREITTYDNGGGNGAPTDQTDHICWRKFKLNTDEYSTEL